MKLFFGTIFPKLNIHEDEQMHILKVLRMSAGEEIFLTDGKGNLAKGNLVIEGKKATLQNVEITENLPKFPRKLHIAIAPTKNMDRIEFFVEKATEMGVAEITFIQTEKSERKHMNIEKVKKQVVSASKQSLRFHFPKVNDLVKFSEFVKQINPKNAYIAHCDEMFERENLQNISSSEEALFLVGPEGDFSPKEIKLLSELGVKAVSLGNQRLRTETAGVFISAWNYMKMMEDN